MYPEHSVSSLSAYLDRIGDIEAEWSSESLGFHEPVWFRGLERSDWEDELRPTIHRLRAASDWALRGDFHRRAQTLLAGEPMPPDEWAWYFTMRHHGVPTRLLDWSEGSLIALYFAVRECKRFQQPDYDPCVWMLAPCTLNKVSIN